MVSQTLTDIENWYKDPSHDQDRCLLLSKLAIIEYCGWIEEWMDEVIREIDDASIRDSDWTRKKVLESNYGFHYDKHFRPMLRCLLGEHKLRKIEVNYDALKPGDLEFIKSSLGNLWATRCKLAHSDLGAHKAAQVTINAPSWTKNQFRVMSKRLDDFKACLLRGI